MKRRICLALIFCVLFFFSSVAQVRAQAPLTATLPAGLAQALAHALPADCSGIGCEGIAPPPINSCANGGHLETNQIDTGAIVFTLYLYSGDCGGFWGAAYYNCTGSCSGQYVTVSALGVWERNSDGGCDTSNKGALDTLPINLSNSHHWESTYMIASDDAPCTFSAFHAAMYASDMPGGSQNLYNTDEWFQ